MPRIGFGYDAHRLVEGRPLILGGHEIPSAFGLEGHSDADVVTHAVIDAIIGALGMGDMGRYFPDTDPAYKWVSSLSMLERVMGWVKEKGLQINNMDATIVAQGPRLASYLGAMRVKLANAMEGSVDDINIKATTTEGLGFCGRREGVEAFAVVTLKEVTGDAPNL